MSASTPAQRSLGADAILSVGERMIGRYGVDGVSMRQIAGAAGLAFQASVQYHYGDKAGLIQAIVDSRQDLLEKRRAELVTKAFAEGMIDDPRTIMEADFRPLFEIRGDEGELIYARFLWQIMRPEQIQSAPSSASPVSRQLRARLKAHLQDRFPGLDEARFASRYNNLLFFLVNAVVTYETAFPDSAETDREKAISEFFDMAAAALTVQPR